MKYNLASKDRKNLHTRATATHTNSNAFKRNWLLCQYGGTEHWLLGFEDTWLWIQHKDHKGLIRFG